MQSNLKYLTIILSPSERHHDIVVSLQNIFIFHISFLTAVFWGKLFAIDFTARELKQLNSFELHVKKVLSKFSATQWHRQPSSE